MALELLETIDRFLAGPARSQFLRVKVPTNIYVQVCTRWVLKKKMTSVGTRLTYHLPILLARCHAERTKIKSPLPQRAKQAIKYRTGVEFVHRFPVLWVSLGLVRLSGNASHE